MPDENERICPLEIKQEQGELAEEGAEDWRTDSKEGRRDGKEDEKRGRNGFPDL